MSADPPRTLTPRAKLATDFGPLAVFLGSYLVASKTLGTKDGVMWSTGLFVVATVAALVVTYRVERRVQPMTLVTAVLVLVLGGLTLYLDDETFIQRKPTLVSGLMGSVLLGGLLFGRSLIEPLMGSSLDMDEEGWRKLTLRWGFFFLAIAGLNEVAWRHMEFGTWLTFKTFGIVGLTFVFLILQAPLIQKHHRPPADGPGNVPPSTDDRSPSDE